MTQIQPILLRSFAKDNEIIHSYVLSNPILAFKSQSKITSGLGKWGLIVAYYFLARLKYRSSLGEEYCYLKNPTRPSAVTALALAVFDAGLPPRFYGESLMEYLLCFFMLFGESFPRVLLKLRRERSVENFPERYLVNFRWLGLMLLMKLMLKAIKDHDNSATFFNKSLPNNTRTGNSVDCTLCWSARSNPTSTPCGHVYCWECIHEWCMDKLEDRIMCPLCRAEFEVQHLIPIRNIK